MRLVRKERVGPTTNQRGEKQRLVEAMGHNLSTGHERYRTRYEVEVVTEGFTPTCSCDADTAPGVVLDPFGGSGTVSLVAKRLGRSSIYIDLNPAYADMAVKRCDFGQMQAFVEHTHEIRDLRREEAGA